MANRNPLCDEFFTEDGLLCPDEEATRAAGRAWSAFLGGRAVLALEGPLGAGKTCFVKGLAEGLGIDPALVASPTFTLVHEYPGGQKPLVHFDLYRLEDASELEAIGFYDYLAAPGICAIEWGDKFPEALPPTAWRLHFEISGTARFLKASQDK